MKHIKQTTLLLSTLTAAVFTSFSASPAPALADDYAGSGATYTDTSTTTDPASGSGYSTGDSSQPIDPTTIDLSQPGDDAFFAYFDDSAPETQDQPAISMEVAAAIALTLLVPAPPVDPCFNTWNAVIQAKSNWLWAVGGAAAVGWIPVVTPFAGGVVLQKTTALIDARKAMRACCANGNANQWSCKEAVRTNYLK